MIAKYNGTDGDIVRWQSSDGTVKTAHINDLILAYETKRGKWEMRPDPYGYFDLIPVCTACGCSNKWREKYSFCPNCGADMRERSKE